MVKLLRNPFSNRIKWFDDKGKPQTLVRTGDTKTFSMTGSDRTTDELKKYWVYYSGEGTVFASLNVTAWNTVMTGYTIESDDNNAEEFIKSFCDKIDIESAFRQATLYALIFGDAFIEKVYTRGKDIKRLKVIDTRTMLINTDKFGDITDYEQQLEGRKVGKKLKPEDIIHIRFNEIPGSPYGLSLISPSLDTIDRKVSTDEALYNAIKRHGTLKWVITVGSEKSGDIPPDEILDNIKKEFEDIDSKNEFVVPWMVQLNTIDEKGIEGVEEYFNYFQTQLVAGLLCPPEALGMGKGSTEATARVRAILYERMIKAYQQRLSRIIMEELFNPMLEKYKFMDKNKYTKEDETIPVYIKFKSVTEEDEALRAKWFGNLIRGGVNPFTNNEIRAMFDFAPREDMKDVVITPGVGYQGDNNEESNEEETPETEEPKEDKEKEKLKEEMSNMDRQIKELIVSNEVLSKKNELYNENNIKNSTKLENLQNKYNKQLVDYEILIDRVKENDSKKEIWLKERERLLSNIKMIENDLNINRNENNISKNEKIKLELELESIKNDKNDLDNQIKKLKLEKSRMIRDFKKLYKIEE